MSSRGTAGIRRWGYACHIRLDMTQAALTRKRNLFVAVLLLFAAPKTKCAAQDAVPDLSEASLEQLGNIKVYSVSKHLQSAGDAP